MAILDYIHYHQENYEKFGLDRVQYEHDENGKITGQKERSHTRTDNYFSQFRKKIVSDIQANQQRMKSIMPMRDIKKFEDFTNGFSAGHIKGLTSSQVEKVRECMFNFIKQHLGSNEVTSITNTFDVITTAKSIPNLINENGLKVLDSIQRGYDKSYTNASTIADRIKNFYAIKNKIDSIDPENSDLSKFNANLAKISEICLGSEKALEDAIGHNKSIEDILFQKYGTKRLKEDDIKDLLDLLDDTRRLCIEAPVSLLKGKATEFGLMFNGFMYIVCCDQAGKTLSGDELVQKLTDPKEIEAYFAKNYKGQEEESFVVMDIKVGKNTREFYNALKKMGKKNFSLENESGRLIYTASQGKVDLLFKTRQAGDIGTSAKSSHSGAYWIQLHSGNFLAMLVSQGMNFTNHYLNSVFAYHKHRQEEGGNHEEDEEMTTTTLAAEGNQALRLAALRTALMGFNKKAELFIVNTRDQQGGVKVIRSSDVLSQFVKDNSVVKNGLSIVLGDRTHLTSDNVSKTAPSLIGVHNTLVEKQEVTTSKEFKGDKGLYLAEQERIAKILMDVHEMTINVSLNKKTLVKTKAWNHA